jgi:two-component system, LytTR family, sensor kinase
MNLEKKNRQLLKIAGIINLVFVLLFIVLILYLRYDDFVGDRYTKKITGLVVANIVCWTVNVAMIIFLLPRLGSNKQKRTWTFYFLSYLVTLFIIQSLAAIVIGKLEIEVPNHPYSPLFYAFVFNTTSLVSIELIISRFEKTNMKLENAALKMMSLEARHEKLKNQLHPHFLFNSLNALKSLIRKDPALAEGYLIKLAEFLRFSISHNEQNIVSIHEELKFSLYYLEMQKIRFRDSLFYSIDESLNTLNGVMLPVFALQLLLENAIKHNTLTNESPLVINIRYVDRDWLLVENNLSLKLHIEPDSGMGLKNLSDRYLLLKADDIKVKKDDNYFRVYIKLLSV